MDWMELAETDVARFAKRFDPASVANGLTGEYRETPFYKNGTLVKLDNGTGSLFAVAVGKGDIAARDLHFLTGKSADIHAANDAADLNITDENKLDYLRFFCAFLTSGGKAFHLMEDMQGHALAGDDDDDALLQAPQDMRLVSSGRNGQNSGYACHGYMAHDGVLCGVTMEVRDNGEVEMLDDDPLGYLVRLH